MELSRILVRELSTCQVIELREIDGQRTFPILIGLPEAQAIERRLQGIELKRPLTHELLGNVIDAFGGTLESICINDLFEGTFFAILNVRTESGELLEIDSRPSDAIALAVRTNSPIYVAEDVMDQAGVEPGEEMSLAEGAGEAEVDDTSDEDLGVFKDLIEGLDLDNPLG